MKVVLRTLLERAEPLAAPGREEAIRLTGVTLTPARGARVVLDRRDVGQPFRSECTPASHHDLAVL